MVTRVVGEVNGSSIIFTKTYGESWAAKVPLSEDGEWVVSLYAYDDAGNSAYLAKILYAVTGHELTIRLLETGFIGELEDRGFIGSLLSCANKKET